LIERQIPVQYKNLLYDVKIDRLEDHVPTILRANFKIPGFSYFSLSHITSSLYSPLVFRKKYDIMVCHGTFTYFTARNLRKYRGLPYLAHIWDPISYILQNVYVDTPLSHFQKFLVPIGTSVDKFILEEAEAVILPCKYHMDRVKRLTKRPIEIVYPAVNCASEIPAKRGNYILAVMKRWEKMKKPLFLLDLLERLKKKGIKVTLIMVGSWKTQRTYEDFVREAKSRNILEQLEIKGEVVSNEELSRYYFGARALIHPISVSGFGMTALEAAAHGTPIIFPKDSGVTDLFVHGVHGFFPKMGDLDSFVEHSETLLSNERKAWEMGFNAWQVAKEYTWLSHTRRLREVIEKYI
jgi:glycosyltransferase involved in cell wall biosynthesis